MAVGLVTQRGPVHAIDALCPLMKGSGYGTVVMSFLYAGYFTAIIVYCLFYLFSSFTSELPWETCEGKEWSTDNCTDSTNNNIGGIPVTQEFFENHVLHKTSGIDEFGNIRWPLFGILLFTWVLIYLFVFKGTKSVGKVVYVTVIAPYVLLLALLIRGCTLSGAYNGIEYFLGLNGKGDWGKLADVNVWVNAASQVYNSIGIGFGSLIAFSSFNRNSSSLLRDTLLIGLVNSFTSIFAGFIIFSVLGHISEMVNIPIDQLQLDGPELIFVSYPQALADMYPSWLWSIMFFFTLFVLGIDSIFSSIECLNITVLDVLTNLSVFMRREVVALMSCAVAFLMGVPIMFDGGIYLYKLFDSYVAVQSLSILATLEIVTIVWVFGARPLCREISRVTGKDVPKVLLYMWLFVTPLIVIVIMIFSIIGYKPLQYIDYVYPNWANAVGWCIASLSLICVPLGIIHELMKYDDTKSLLERFKYSVRPKISKYADMDMLSSRSSGEKSSSSIVTDF
ncbi:Oidioi.mRNA.OKI2018_I69.chr2.g7741.t1.cds [Oikopleura dioica]|uniref:Oidioi.mRNA.OKI2018_I69.chr2.g7741.t1.cds n=1 Tax=Oikopleura dioica TaxID=34765 RepID=A0ABN7TFU8_OIKDI|nr:Oidioi.mRNA.OKI2018_I69.chr2.g7741.t1.cds [Oikopleura dioica]